MSVAPFWGSKYVWEQNITLKHFLPSMPWNFSHTLKGFIHPVYGRSNSRNTRKNKRILRNVAFGNLKCCGGFYECWILNTPIKVKQIKNKSLRLFLEIRWNSVHYVMHCESSDKSHCKSHYSVFPPMSNFRFGVGWAWVELKITKITCSELLTNLRFVIVIFLVMRPIKCNSWYKNKMHLIRKVWLQNLTY